MTNTMFSVWVVVVFGIIGYLLKTLDVPLAPLVMGLVLGPLLEKSLAQTMSLGEGSFAIVFQKPIALGIFVLAAVLFVAPSATGLLRRRRRGPVTAPRASVPATPAPDGEATASASGTAVAPPPAHEQADSRQDSPPHHPAVTAPTGALSDVSDRRN
jgi:putative tricarboxylic transport membrane protein